MRNLLALIVASALLLTGCTLQRDFSHFDERHDRAHESIMAGIDRTDADNPDRETLRRRLHYMLKLSSLHMYLGTSTAMTEIARLTPEEYRGFESLLSASYDLIDVYAAYPGEVDGEGRVIKFPEGPDFERVVAQLRAQIKAGPVLADD